MKMIKIFFGSDPAIREQLTQQLTTYSVDFQAYEEEELSEQIFLEMLKMTSDFFDLLSPNLMQYKLDNRMTLKQFIHRILSDKDKCLRFPIAMVDDLVYSGVTADDARMFIPKEHRKIERAYLFGKLEELDTGRLFWRNLDLFRKQSELRWYEFNDLMFSDESKDMGKVKRIRDQFFLYKKNKKIPPEYWIDKAARIFLVEREDFFRKAISDLQYL
jgi:conserved domain protein